MRLNDLFGVREFHYKYNQPLLVRYVFSDSDLLSELNERFYPNTLSEGLASADLSTLKEYQAIIRFRDTQVFDPQVKSALRKIHEGITELISYRLLAGEDKYLLREDTLDNMERSGI